jgi:hypothetical protein
MYGKKKFKVKGKNPMAGYKVGPDGYRVGNSSRGIPFASLGRKPGSVKR